MVDMKVYFSRWIFSYGTPEDELCRKAIKEKFNVGDSDLIDPSECSHFIHPMSFYLKLVDEADVIVYREVLPGYISAGVVGEVEHGLDEGN